MFDNISHDLVFQLWRVRFHKNKHMRTYLVFGFDLILQAKTTTFLQTFDCVQYYSHLPKWMQLLSVAHVIKPSWDHKDPMYTTRRQHEPHQSHTGATLTSRALTSLNYFWLQAVAKWLGLLRTRPHQLCMNTFKVFFSHPELSRTTVNECNHIYMNVYNIIDMSKQGIQSLQRKLFKSTCHLDWIKNDSISRRCLCLGCICHSNESNGLSGLSTCKEPAEFSTKKIKVVTPAASSKLWGVNILARAASVACLIIFVLQGLTMSHKDRFGKWDTTGKECSKQANQLRHSCANISQSYCNHLCIWEKHSSLWGRGSAHQTDQDCFKRCEGEQYNVVCWISPATIKQTWFCDCRGLQTCIYRPSIQIDLLMTSRQHSMQHITENVPKTLAGTRCELPHELRVKGWKNIKKYWSHKHETFESWWSQWSRHGVSRMSMFMLLVWAFLCLPL